MTWMLLAEVWQNRAAVARHLAEAQAKRASGDLVGVLDEGRDLVADMRSLLGAQQPLAHRKRRLQ